MSSNGDRLAPCEGHSAGDHGPGHGLGLAIVRAVAEAHGAVLTASPRLEGGLDVTALLE